MAKKKVALYIRVSTSQQNTAMQRQALENYCKQRGWEVCKVYEDIASGSNDNREALTGMMADAKGGRFDVIGVWRFDRFARSTKALLSALEVFRGLGIEFFSLQEQIDTSTPAGKVLYTLIAAFSEFERETIRQRVKAGLDAARAKGKRIGRPKVKLDSEQLAELNRQGLSIRQIASRLGVSKATVHNYLQSV